MKYLIVILVLCFVPFAHAKEEAYFAAIGKLAIQKKEAEQAIETCEKTIHQLVGRINEWREGRGVRSENERLKRELEEKKDEATLSEVEGKE